jgi:hypothetical protein
LENKLQWKVSCCYKQILSLKPAILYIKAYILKLQWVSVCLSGQFSSTARTSVFFFFLMGFVFCDSYYSIGALCTRFTLVRMKGYKVRWKDVYVGQLMTHHVFSVNYLLPTVVFKYFHKCWKFEKKKKELQKKASCVDDDNSHNLRFIHDYFFKNLGGGALVAEKWKKRASAFFLLDQFSRYTKPHGLMDK